MGPTAPDTEQGNSDGGSPHEGRRQTWRTGKASSDIPAFKPYRGKPAVRNFRGGDGNVGIIRSPVRAMVLPDNRHAVEDEREERSSEPPGLESCAGSREAAVEA